MAPIKIKKPKRSYSGEKWKTNRANKKWLEKDFSNRCAYCDDWDLFNGKSRSYHVEHFAPKDKFPALEFKYENLLYACPYCNGAKSNKWPSSDPTKNVIGDKGFLDPCEDEYYKHLHRNNDGSIGYDTLLGKYIYEELGLNLFHHKAIYRITSIDTYLDRLDEKIKILEAKGCDTTKLNKIKLMMLDEFRHLIKSY